MMTELSNRLVRVSRFLLRQAREIGEGGLPVLFHKGGTLLVITAALLAVLLVRALRPLLLIRFGALRSDRLGHFASNTELYLCERDAGMHGRRTFDIFYHNSPVCNQQLKKMWDRTIGVLPSVRIISRPITFIAVAGLLNRLLPGYEAHVIPPPSDRDIHGLLKCTPPHLSFTTEEERQGRKMLLELGIPEGAPFVCFYARESAYLDDQFRSRNWEYHDYRDSNIHNYLPAAEELVQRGYYAIRMGAVVKEALTTNNPRIVDYAFNRRSDFMDIYLGAHCWFFLGSTGGVPHIPAIFRVPLAIANSIPLGLHPALPGKNDIFIPKKLWLREERCFLTFRETLDSGAGRFLRSEQYEQLGVEVVENTPEEITALAVEMDERLKGTWQTTEEDEELQHRFWSLFNPTHPCYGSPSRIGAEFLRQNRALLD